MAVKLGLTAIPVAMALLAACGSDGAITIEELPGRYYQALADDDWSTAWDAFSADAKGRCTREVFQESREWFREQSGEGYDFWLSRYREASEGEWTIETFGDTATARLAGQEVGLEAVLEDSRWRIADSGEYNSCLQFQP